MSNIIKQTIGLCPTCYREVPAVIAEQDGQAVILKDCPGHGASVGLIEKDCDFYLFTLRNNGPIYEGLVIDVTYRCNLRCKWCYQFLANEDVPHDRIYQLANTQPKGSHIILSGGEPTLLKDLDLIVHNLAEKYDVAVLTNGLNIDWTFPCGWGLSYHEEGRELFDKAIASAREGGHKFRTIIYTVDTSEEFDRAVSESFTLSDICTVFRIHAAAPVGADGERAGDQLCISEMVGRLRGKHEITPHPCKSSFLPVKVDGVQFLLISWPTVHNMDVVEMRTAPWYYGKTDEIDHLVLKIIEQEGRHANSTCHTC